MKRLSVKPVNIGAFMRVFLGMIKWRFDRAVQAFRSHMEMLKRKESALVEEKSPVFVAFLSDPESVDLAGLKLGEQVRGDLKLKLTAEKLSVLSVDGVTDYYHGDQVELEGSSYHLSMLSAPSIGRSFLSFIGLLFVNLFLLGDPLVAEEVQSRRDFQLVKRVQGLHQVEPGSVSVKVFGEEQTYHLNDVRASRYSEPVHIFVDTSSLCLQREMNESINAGLADFLSKLSRQSSVSVSEYYLDHEGTEVYRKIIDNQSAGQLAQRSQLVQCREEVRSLNALGVLARLDDSEIKGHFLIVSSGNLRPVEGLDKRMRDSGVFITVALYTPHLSDYASGVLGSFADFFLWQNDEPHVLSEKTRFPWVFRVNNQLPLDLEPKTYSYELSVGEALSVNGSIVYKKDRVRIAFYRTLFVLSLALLLLLVFSGIWLAVQYYRQPICKETGRALSRKWKGSLHAAKARHPVLFLMENESFKGAYVVDKERTRVGKSLSSDFRVSCKVRISQLEFRQVAENCYSIRSLDDKAFRLNGRWVSGEQALRCDDVIQLSENLRLEFRWAAVAERKSEEQKLEEAA